MQRVDVLNLNHIQYFVDAAELGGLSPAARKNYVTQSALSRAIAKLEDDLDVQLILHKKNSFQLTEAAEALKESCKEILQSVQNLKQSARNLTSEYIGPLRFGCNESIASKIIGPMLTRIEARFPKINPTILLGNTDKIQKLIMSGDIDFGIVMNDGEVSKFYKIIPIFEGTFTVVKSPSFSKDLTNNLIVSRVKPGGMSERFIRAYKAAYGITLKPKIVVASWQVIMDLAINGYGYALVPEFLCRQEIAMKKLEVLKCKVGSLPFGLCMITAKNRVLPKNADTILSEFRQLNKK